ncbi:MAG: ABC transporter permease [Chloroflexi bacterium]|nr:ABC transporter permease [Chloroflexota bacterium]
MDDTRTIVPQTALERKRRNPLKDFLTRMVRTKPLGTISGVIVLLFFFVGVFAGILAPFGFNEQFRGEYLTSPSLSHWLGTDNIGRDIFSRIIYGARISMIVGVVGSLTSLVVSCAIGLPTGYFGGKFDLLAQRFIDAWIVFPDLILLILLVALVGPGLWNIVFILGLTYGLGGSRSVRGAVIGIRQNAYIESAKAIGASTPRILLRHLLPNIAPFLLVLVSTRMPGMMLAEAGLSFLGLGVPPPTPSWGGMLSGAGINYMYAAPLLSIWPGLALSIVVYSSNMLGDALRDLLDPKLRGARG